MEKYLNKIIHGDSLEKLKLLPDNSVDLVVTDPPYGYSFMGKNWDKAVPSVEIWKETLRVLKPGGFAFIMSAPRQDVLSQMIVRIGEAGFKTDFTSLYWTYASGFPKAMNIGKMVDKRMGVKQVVIGKIAQPGSTNNRNSMGDGLQEEPDLTIATSAEAKALDGSYGGFQPKPALECIIQAQKPLTLEGELTIITSQVLCQLQYVNFVVPNLYQAKTVRDYIALKPATEQIVQEVRVHIGKVGSQYGLMDMLKSILDELEIKPNTSWNTDSLWKIILADLLRQTSKFTTEITIELITELKTLNFLLVQSIQNNTTRQNGQNGQKLNALIVESVLESVITRLLSLNQTTALKSAGSKNLKKEEHTPVLNAEINSEVITRKENTADKSATNKPEVRVVLVAMKPLSEKTYVDQALKNGKGITWLDDCRIGTEQRTSASASASAIFGNAMHKGPEKQVFGRFPANLLVSDDVLNENSKYFSLDTWAETLPFLHVSKASKSEKNRGLEGFEEKVITDGREKLENYQTAYSAGRAASRNIHPTVKPLKLMSYLITLGSREGDIVLEPFAGSGTTCIAAKELKRNYIGIELTEEYIPIIEARLQAVTPTLL